MTAPTPTLARPRERPSGSPELLATHLEEARNCARSLLPDSGSNADLNTVVDVAAYLHDFGKLNSYFQRYIHSIDQGNPDHSISRKKRSHAFLGALATQHVLRHHEYGPEWQVVGFLAVTKHHAGHLPDVRRISEYMGETDFGPFAGETTIEQLESIIEEEQLRHAAGRFLAEARPDDVDPESAFFDFVHDIENRDTLTLLEGYHPSSSGDSEYVRLLRVWSTLTCADKLASVGASVRDPTPLDPQRITDHIREFPAATSEVGRALNRRREQARTTCRNRVDEFLSAETNIGRLTLPTGFGKTLTGTQTALEIACRKQGRVIYALPYTSIIDQTDEILQTVFDLSPLEQRYTIHHHLAETRTRNLDSVGDGDTIPFGTQRLLAHTWQSDLVLTTFVQLFESIASPTNRQSLKLPALQDSVILVDEPQALSHDWWRLITNLSQILCEHYNVHMIFMTATQPGFFDNVDGEISPFELLPDGEPYFGFMQNRPRVEFELHPSVQQYIDDPGGATGVTIPEAASEIATVQTGSVLAICNTVQNTILLSGSLRDQLDELTNLNLTLQTSLESGEIRPPRHDDIVDTLVERSRGGAVVATLTTRIRPVDRKLLLRAIRRLLEAADTDLYVVSTQLVEAGVDLSFDRLFRDLAPVPSIVQAAGRCNREFGGTKKPVTVWRLQGLDGQGVPSRAIYTQDYDLLYPTREALSPYRSVGTISEATMIDDVVDSYYVQLHATATPGDDELVDFVRTARFGKLARASLISDEISSVDVIVCTDRQDRALVELYRDCLEQGYYEWSTALKRHLASRTISVVDDSFAPTDPALEAITDDEYYVLDADQYLNRYELAIGGGIRREVE